MPRLYNLLTDMREDYDLIKLGGRDGGEGDWWVVPVMFKKIVAHKGSLTLICLRHADVEVVAGLELTHS